MEFSEHLCEAVSGSGRGSGTSRPVVIVSSAGQAEQMRHNVWHALKHVVQRRAVLLTVERRQLPLSNVRQSNSTQLSK